jgi:hypothetical protein
VRSSTAIATCRSFPSGPTSSNNTSTSCVRICESITIPSPSGVPTRLFFRGSFFFNSSYVSSSYRRQHISRPHRPEIFSGSSVAFCTFALFIDTGLSTFRKFLQQQYCPHRS